MPGNTCGTWASKSCETSVPLPDHTSNAISRASAQNAAAPSPNTFSERSIDLRDSKTRNRRPSPDPKNNTAWCGESVTLSPGDTKTLSLDFFKAQAWGITDNPYPHTGGGKSWADGKLYSINARDLREVTNIGFEIYDASGGAGAGKKIVLEILPEPATLMLLAFGAVAVIRTRRRGAT